MRIRAIEGLVLLVGAAALGMAYERYRHVAQVEPARVASSASASASCMRRPTAPVPKPEKRAVVDALLADKEKSVFLHLDPRRAGVIVPGQFRGDSSLVLQVGYRMAIPIPDLRVDDAGVAGTLSFHATPHPCVIPWSALYAAVGEDGRGIVWEADAPNEVFCQ